MPRCSFCTESLAPGTGTMVIRNDGRIFHFCSMKCRKNMLKLKRDPKKVKWISRKLKK